mmetsp:Transcript_21023/g.66041  ORF Transcript_21023/g.66041 Transcript_21023/m.66041 type:complete len:259 (-) Transcript_21023:126-902(-)
MSALGMAKGERNLKRPAASSAAPARPEATIFGGKNLRSASGTGAADCRRASAGASSRAGASASCRAGRSRAPGIETLLGDGAARSTWPLAAGAARSFSSFWKYFCACDRTWTVVLVPTMSATLVHFFPNSSRPCRNLVCSSSVHRPVFSLFDPPSSSSFSPPGDGGAVFFFFFFVVDASAFTASTFTAALASSGPGPSFVSVVDDDDDAAASPLCCAVPSTASSNPSIPSATSGRIAIFDEEEARERERERRCLLPPS